MFAKWRESLGSLATPFLQDATASLYRQASWPCEPASHHKLFLQFAVVLRHRKLRELFR